MSRVDWIIVKRRSAIKRVCSLLLAGLLFPCQGAVVPGDDFNADTTAAAMALQQWYNNKGRWDTTDWWNAANCLEAVEDVIVASNGRDLVDVLSNTFELNAGNNYLNDYYDDEGWWALAWIRAYDITGEERYLEMAKTIFEDMTHGWDSFCDGGLQWRKSQRYKNAIPNELFLLVAIRLHQRSPGDGGPGSYWDWALKEWNWFKNSGLINPQNLVNDGLDRNCRNNGRTTWTYNQGVILGGLTELYKTTGDSNYLHQATAIADAVIRVLVDSNGILHEPCEDRDCPGKDTPQFKGIFIRYLAQLYRATGQPVYFDFLFRNAHSVWFDDRDGTSHLGLKWGGPFDQADAARHSSAMMAISALAEPATAQLLFAKGSGSAAFNHALGAAFGTLAWRCSSSNAAQAGFVQSGPYLSSLSAGRHTVHFRIAVSVLSHSATNLIRLEVGESSGGTLLASREVAWKSFVQRGEPQDFELPFTNLDAGNPLEFRVFWNHAVAAPAVTVTDVTLDGFHNWTAANLEHQIGHLDGFNGWQADPIHEHVSGYLATGPGTRELPAGAYVAQFELKVDNFNWDASKLATLTVVDADSGEVLTSREVKRNQFSNILYQVFSLEFKAAAGKRYDFRTYWYYTPRAPTLTQRSLVVKPLEKS